MRPNQRLPIPGARPVRRLYFAYGPVAATEAIKKLCPDARPVQRARLNHHRLVFRPAADVEVSIEDTVSGAIWSVSKECEEALDKAEGLGAGREKVETTAFDSTGERRTIFWYRSTDQSTVRKPSPRYFAATYAAYEEWLLPVTKLYHALDLSEAYDGREYPKKDGAVERLSADPVFVNSAIATREVFAAA